MFLLMLSTYTTNIIIYISYVFFLLWSLVEYSNEKLMSFASMITLFCIYFSFADVVGLSDEDKWDS